MKKKLYSGFIAFLILLLVVENVFSQNVGINNTNPLSTLDVSGSFGYGIRSVSASATLTSTDATVLASPGITLTLPASAGVTRRAVLIVYNGSYGGSAVTIKASSPDHIISNNVSYASAVGILLNIGSIELQTDGSGNWYSTINSGAQGGNDWLLSGNAGTTVANFLGTTDNFGFGIRTNNTQRIHIDSLGRVGIGSNSIGLFDPANPEKFLVDYGITTSATIANFTGSINNFLQINVQNKNSGINASSDFVATADNGTDTSVFADFGINSSTYSPSVENFGGPNDAFLYCNSRNLVIGTQVSTSDIIFLINGGSIKNNSAFRIMGPNGNVVVGKGEGTTTPLGNILRGPNALSIATNTAGGNLTIIGGSSTGTATGGSVNIAGGATVSGTPGSVNINSNSNFPTNINTGTSSQNVSVGGSSNNILFPKFTTVGGMFYTSAITGQISGTTQMIWDNTNTRLGIGITVPTTTLQVNGTASLGSAAATTGILSFLNSTNVKAITVQAGITSDGYSLILPLTYGTANQALSIASITGTVITLGWLTPGSVSAWQLAGNTGTISTNFLGTTDNTGLGFRTKNIQRMRIDSVGSVGIGSMQFDPLNREKLLVDYGTTTSDIIASFKGSIDNYLSVDLQNKSIGTDASSEFQATADNGTDSTNNINMGIHGSTFAPAIDDFGGPDDGYLYSFAKHLVIGTQSPNTDLIFMTAGGSIKNNTDLRIIGATSNIVIGKGEGTIIPVGNILRGPNGAAGNNIGGNLTIQGGAATGTATGGSLNINGGATGTGTPGSVNINSNSNFPTNINTGTSTPNVTIGGSSNNILFPKFTTIGGIFYTSAITGQISGTTQMIWDNTNARLGIGIAVPTTTLQVNGIATLGSASATTGAVSFLNSTNAFSVGVQPGITSASYMLTLPTAIGTAAQALTITSIVGSTATLGWTSAGSGTVIGSGTATQVAFWSSGTALTSNANLFWDNTNTRLGIGTATPTTTLQVNGTATLGKASATTGILSVLNSTNAFSIGIQPGITSASYTLTLPTTIGAANQALTISGVVGVNATLAWTALNTGTVTGSGTATQVAFWSSASGLASSANLFWDNTNTRLGIQTATPGADLDVNGTFRLGATATSTILNNIIKTTFSANLGSLTTQQVATFTVTVTGVNANATIILNPQVNFPSGVTVLFVRASAANTIVFSMINGSAATATMGVTAFDICAIQ